MIKFVGSFETVRALPHHPTIKEFAFVGRSNVGKSSLLNAVVGEKIAMVSNTPGRTRSLNLFNWDDAVWLVDLPGYGYAKAAKSDQVAWLKRLEEYLLERKELKLLFILIDSRHGVKDIDKVIIDFCKEESISYKIVYTKTDKKDSIKNLGEGIVTSAEKKIGIEEVKRLLR